MKNFFTFLGVVMVLLLLIPHSHAQIMGYAPAPSTPYHVSAPQNGTYTITGPNDSFGTISQDMFNTWARGYYKYDAVSLAESGKLNLTQYEMGMLNQAMQNSNYGKNTQGILDQANNQAGMIDTIGNFILAIFDFTIALTMWLMGILMYLAGLLVDFASQMRTIANTDVVRDGWTFTRDALNFVFIIILLVMSFSHIVGLDSYGIKKLLPRIIISALLVNFSLAIAGAFLQVGNILTDTILEGLNTAKVSEEVAKCRNGSTATGTSITCYLANSAAIGGQFKYDKASSLSLIGLDVKSFTRGTTLVDNFTPNIEWKKSFAVNAATVVQSAAAVLFVALFTIALVVLGATIMIRLITLVLLCILAPVPYVFSLIPNMGGYSKDWWSRFIQNVLYLPIVIFFLVLAIRMTGYMDSTSGSDGSGKGLMQQFGAKISDLKLPDTAEKPLLNIFDTLFISAFIFVAIYMAKTLGSFGGLAIVQSKAFDYAKRATMGVGTAPAKGLGRGAEALKDAGGRKLANTRAAGAIANTRNVLGKVSRGIGGTKIDEQIAEQQKGLAGKSGKDIEAACRMGNAGACMKLAESGDLEKADFPAAMKTVPKNTAAYDKMNSAWKKKDPVRATLGSDMQQKLQNVDPNKPETAVTLDKKQKEDLQKAFQKIKPEDYAKLDAKDLKAAMNAGIKMPMNKSQLNAVADSSNVELQEQAHDYIKELENSAKSPGQKALVTYARSRVFKKENASNNPTDQDAFTARFNAI